MLESVALWVLTVLACWHVSASATKYVVNKRSVRVGAKFNIEGHYYRVEQMTLHLDYPNHADRVVIELSRADPS